MAFLKISFPLRRPVLIDGVPDGFTGEVLRVEEGFHTFELGEPRDYTPASIGMDISESSLAEPIEIVFEPMSWPPPGGKLPPAEPAKVRDPGKGSRPGTKRKRPSSKRKRPGSKRKK